MKASVRNVGEVSVLSVTGRLDSNTSPEFESRIVSLIDSGEKAIVVNCAELEYISSAGLRVLLLAAKKLKSSGGRIALASLEDHIREVFEITRFTTLFPIHASTEEALEALGAVPLARIRPT